MEKMLQILESIEEVLISLLVDFQNPQNDEKEILKRVCDIKNLLYSIITKTDKELQEITNDATWTASTIYAYAQTLLRHIDNNFKKDTCENGEKK